MKRRKLLSLAAAALLAALCGTAQAQMRFDIDIMVPFKAGFVSDIAGLGDGGTQGQFSDINFILPIPDVQALLQADLGIVKLGGGARFFSVILESLAMPTLFGEVDLGPLSLNTSVGGYAFLLFGLYNNFSTQNIMAGDINVGYALADWFRVTVGFFGVTPFQDMNNYVGVIYLGGKFVLQSGQK